MDIRKNGFQISFKIFIIMFLSLAQILVSVSCTLPDGLSGQSSENESSPAASSSAASTSDIIKSGTLRLWMQPPVTLNPLVSDQYQWNQLSHLFYESLFDIDSRQRLTNDLVNSYTASDDGLIYRIVLKDKVLFHDNSSLDSQDVLSTIQFIQNQSSKSIYYDLTRNIASVSIIDSKTLVIRLIRLDPFFLYDMIFPVLSSETIDKQDIGYQPGTGLYKITSYEKEKQLNAVLFNKNRNSKDCRIKSVKVLELADTRAAMQAFGDDEVDIVTLKDLNYDAYYLRNDMKFSRYPGNKFIFFEMNQNDGKQLDNQAKADYIRSLITSPSLLDGIENIFISKAAIPVLPTNPMVHQNQCKDVLTVENKQNPFKSGDEALKLIYPLADMVKEMIVTKLTDIFKLQGIEVIAEGQAAAKYNDIVKAGEYDIALRETTLTSNPDPSWLYLQTSLRPMKDIETINKAGSEQFIQAQTSFQLMFMMPKLQISADNLCGILNKLARYGPFIGIGFRINGIILSKRINGQIDSNSFNQYNNIKDVWVWSGQ
ncbi:MAG: ABC transporter substrate-binding protein [Saccharofermentanales bacterium]